MSPVVVAQEPSLRYIANSAAHGRLRDFIRPRRDKVQPSSVPNLPWVGMEHVEAHTMRLLDTKLSAELKSLANRFYPGDVLYGRLRPYLNKVWRAHFEGTCSAEFIVLPKTIGVNPDYLRYRLNSADFVTFASHLDAGDRPRVDFDQIGAFELSIPGESEQGRVVARLDEQLSRLDASVAALHRAQANLKRYRASVLKAACEGRLLPTEAVRSGLAELPEGWRFVPLDTIARVTGGLAKSSSRASSSPTRDVPYLRVANVQRGYLDLAEVKTIPATDKDIADLRLEAGDVLFNEGGDRDKLGRGHVWAGELPLAIHQNHVFRARPDSGVVLSRYLSMCGNGYGVEWFWKHAKQSVNLASISLATLRKFPVALPSLAEQHRIVAEADRRLSLVRSTEAQIAASLARAKRLRQSILQAAFSPPEVDAVDARGLAAAG